MSNLSDPFDREVPYKLDVALPAIGSGIYVWADGDLAFVTQHGEHVGPHAVVAGQLVPFRVQKILTGTTATISVGV